MLDRVSSLTGFSLIVGIDLSGGVEYPEEAKRSLFISNG
jgi:hypothetical protein